MCAAVADGASARISQRGGAGTPPGWYDDGTGCQRWWDGRQWTGHVQGNDYADGAVPVMSFESEIAGKRALVHLFSDRIEFVSRVGVSAGKVTAGLLTGGLSLAVTGVGKGGYAAGGVAGAETLFMTSITRVSSVRNGSHTVVSIATPTGVLPLRLGHGEAIQVMQTLNVLVANAAGQTAQAAAPVVVQVTPPAMLAQAEPATTPAAPDSATQIAKLAELHRAGALSAAEFSAAKAKVLGI